MFLNRLWGFPPALREHLFSQTVALEMVLGNPVPMDSMMLQVALPDFWIAHRNAGVGVVFPDAPGGSGARSSRGQIAGSNRVLLLLCCNYLVVKYCWNSVNWFRRSGMSEKGGKKKRYEPPLVKEIGGVFEQAMGLSSCSTGSIFQSDCSAGNTFGQACSAGPFASGGCVKGNHDNPAQCKWGSSVSGCAWGLFG